MYTYNLLEWLTFFYLYCFFGWIFESSYVSLKERRLVNRGFLRIPLLPLYGSGAIMMLWVSIPVQDNLFLTYVSGVIGATILEYVTGYVMERLFRVRYWDYSSNPFNLHGYICLGSSLAWGFLTIFMTHVIHKPIERAVLSMPVLWDALFVAVITVVFVYDAVVCTKEALAFGKALDTMQKFRQELEDFHVQTALLRMEAEDRMEEARAELKEQVATRLDLQHAKLETAKERLSALSGMTPEDLVEKIGIRVENLIAMTAEERRERLASRPEFIKSLVSFTPKRLRFHKHRFLSNPSASSKKYASEFKTLKELFEQGENMNTFL